MGFPLGDWIDEHRKLPYDLGSSGMAGAIHLPPAGGSSRSGDTPEELRRQLARLHGVEAERVFLTTGATNGTTLCLTYLARATGAVRTPRCRIIFPEYPPIPDTALFAGFRIVVPEHAAEVAAISLPHNPDGRLLSASALRRLANGTQALLVDETFREFTDRPSFQTQRIPHLWTVGSLTKAYAADDVRVGWVIPPPEASERFSKVHGLVVDALAPASVAEALRRLRLRRTILARTRRVFEENLRTLRSAVPGVPRLYGPVWFDRPPNGDGDALAHAAADAGILVCPGSFFGDRRGVRLTLTRGTFPASLKAYLELRERFAHAPSAP